ncbi:MAG: lamin tail domain-containing protein [Dysgonamonadaceae bacterium]|jgi:Na+-transporting methylmalonyl-CoA/oxaloacetate decarboxylase gamma subunit|nr:lamin tail domain-containing protein [Dysgonamonadaceae bacterium]
MKSLINFTLILVSLLFAAPAFSQAIKYVRINEIQVHNSDGFRDEYGRTSGWIELHNTGYGKVNVAGCVLKINGEKFKIPQGNPATIIPTKGYLVFFADGAPNRGPFHTNFTLEDTNFIELFDTDGKLIDRLEFNPTDMLDGVSFGWFEEHDGKEKLKLLPAITPGSTNNTEEKISRSESFRQADPTGAILTLINIVIVAIALTLLFFVFKYMGNYHVRAAVRKAEKANPEQNGTGITIAGKKKGVLTNDELAAIAIALHKYVEDLHSIEKSVLTINMTSKAYSPWSSKIYNLRQVPNKK